LSPELAELLSGARRSLVLHADSLLALREAPSEIGDLLLADPPYSSGGAFRGDRAQATSQKYVTTQAEHVPEDFDGDTRDQRSFELWTALWTAEALRIAKPGCVAAVFTDWRQLGATIDAFQAGGWVFRGVVAWDKTEGTRPRQGGFRAQCEFIVWGTKGPLIERPGVVLPGCFRYSVGQKKLHQAVKPEPLITELLRLCPADGLVVDPFCGSGTAGLCSLRAGLRYLGWESAAFWHALSTERIAAEAEGSTLLARQSGQGALFGAGGGSL
jgi:site-specific DNA-methyltransferase (adenine-specific)